MGDDRETLHLLRSPIKHFDQRLTSELSQKQLSPIKFNKHEVSSLDTPIQTSSSTSMNDPDNVSSLDWMKLTKISEMIYSPEFRDEHGIPTYLSISNEYISIGTSKRNIVIFGYNQNLMHTIQDKNIGPNVGITAMSMSIDSTYIAIGYSNGHINLWDLKKSDPIIAIKPLNLEELQFNGKHHHIAHFQNTPIRKIMFVGSRHTSFVSSDDSGMLLLHNGGRSLVGYYCRSSILYGDYKQLNVIKDRVDNNRLLDFHLLPVGVSPSLTDNVCVLAVITVSKVEVHSILPRPRKHFEIEREKTENNLTKISPHIEWYPSVKDTMTNIDTPPMIVFGWSNDIHVVSIQSELLNDEVFINYHEENSLITEETNVSLKWLNHGVILALTNSQKMVFFDASNFLIIQESDLMSKNIRPSKMMIGNDIGFIEKDYSGSLGTFKSNIYMFQDQNIMICRMNNWADILLKLLAKKDYITALQAAKRQFKGETDLTLIGLPKDDFSRKLIMQTNLGEILKSSVKYLFDPEYETSMDFSSKVDLILEVALMIDLGQEIYDLIYETLLQNNKEKYFFDALQDLVFSNQKVVFSPTIMKAMVNSYVERDDIETLERIICLLDIEKLDIDLTVSLCRKYQLNETLTYIWTSLLKDFVTPLTEAIDKIKKLNETDDKIDVVETTKMLENLHYVYPYLSYTLTGRRYPTDKFLDENDSLEAKISIYKILLNCTPDADHSLFDSLITLLKFDSSSMFSCLNECFEDDFLNSSSSMSGNFKVNRQYIIDILFGIFIENGDIMAVGDKIRFSIFVARNLPKYSQFIRLSDSMTDQIIDILCSVNSVEDCDDVKASLFDDCELALQSLLSVYRPIDIELLFLKIEKVGFNGVLLTLYQSEQRYYDTLKLWITIKGSLRTTQNAPVIPVTELIQLELKHGDKTKVIKLLHDNLELLVSSDLENLVPLICDVCPDINSQVVTFKDSRIKFAYLRAIFNISGRNNTTPLIIDDKLQLEFLKDLIKQRDDSKISFETYKDMDPEECARSIADHRKKANHKIRSFVNNLTSINSNIRDVLKENDFELLAEWYISKNEFEKCASFILELMNEVSSDMIELGYTQDLDEKLWKLLELYFSTLVSTNDALHAVVNNISVKEKLLLQIIEATVENLGLVEKTDDVNSKISDTFKRIVQSTFQFVIDMSRDNSQLFSTVFTKFLDGKSTNETNLGDVKFVLKELFMSYGNSKQILDIIQALVDEDMFEDVKTLEAMKLRGRSPKNIECETCGKKIWGGRVGNQVYEHWRRFKLQIIDDESDDIRDLSSDLIIFKCKHTYHRKCVESMGMVDDGSKECIVCKDA